MRRKYQFSDFQGGNVWLIFRQDAFVNTGPVDVYTVMALPSRLVLSFEITETELTQKQVDALLEKALFKAGKVPSQILLANDDPIELFLQKSVKNLQIKIEMVPGPSLEDLTKDVKFISSKESDEGDEDDDECAKRMIPDSYAPCPCASGLKYKFCCKRIFEEVIEAMDCAENGRYEEALEWIAKAKKSVGNTAEVLCREAIVYSFFDAKKSRESLKLCLEVNPKHPRAHYIHALDLKDQRDFKGAIKAYERAASYYLPTDHYHLNEVHNNLGVIYYELGDLVKAKAEFELAFYFLPEDKLTRRNLYDLIYSKEKK